MYFPPTVLIPRVPESGTGYAGKLGEGYAGGILCQPERPRRINLRESMLEEGGPALL
jgi:hypothetical protein